MAKRKRKIPKYLPEILLFVGIFFVTISSIHNIVRLRALSLDKAIVDSYLEQPNIQSASPNYPVHIKIPWYVDVDIEPQVYAEGSWTISPDKASYLTASALPGENGNIIIYGHNKRSILGNIRALKGSEIITLTMTDGSIKKYQVKSLTEVAPNNTKLLSPTDSETLTIYTCSGLLDSQRFVLRAIPLI